MQKEVITLIVTKEEDEWLREDKNSIICTKESGEQAEGLAFVLTMNIREATHLKGLVQNPSCHPSEEDPKDRRIRQKFWLLLTQVLSIGAGVEFDPNITTLSKMVETIRSDGNWNYDSYNHGYANGLILALAILKNEDPDFLNPPDVWKCNKGIINNG